MVLQVRKEQVRDLTQIYNTVISGTWGAYALGTGWYREITPSAAPFPTAVTWYTDVTKTMKVVEKLITRDSFQRPTTIQWNVYASDGVTIDGTITDTPTYASAISPFEVSRTRTIT